MHNFGLRAMLTSLFSQRQWRCLTLLAVLLLYHRGESLAQAPGVPPAPGAPAAPGFRPGVAAAAAAPQAAPGVTFFRLTYLTLDQWSFISHPYYQITGEGAYANGHSAVGGSFFLSESKSDANADFFTKLIHSVPPFGLEWGQGTDFFLPKTVGFGFDYFRFSQQDTSAASGGSVLPIVTDTYLYCGVLRFYAFDATQPGLNYFVGVGLGMLSGTLYADPYVGQAPQTISYGESPFGTTRFGLDAKGQNAGFRYELILVNSDKVKFSSNPYRGNAYRTIDFSGTIMRLSLFYDFK
jgi:hypothetical protein